jgi:hypothetical protein
MAVVSMAAARVAVYVGEGRAAAKAAAPGVARWEDERAESMEAVQMATGVG